MDVRLRAFCQVKHAARVLHFARPENRKDQRVPVIWILGVSLIKGDEGPFIGRRKEVYES